MNKVAKLKAPLRRSTAHLSALDQPTEEEIDSQLQLTRSKVTNFSLTSYQAMNKTDVLAAQNLLRHGSDFGYWETPYEWAPQLGEAERRIDLRQRIAWCLSPSMLELLNSKDPKSLLKRSRLELLIENATLKTTQYALLLRVGPAGMKKQATGAPLSPKYIADTTYKYMPAMCAAAIEKAFKKLGVSSGAELFSVLQRSDFETLPNYRAEKIAQEFERMRRLFDRGFWNDTPEYEAPKATTSPEGPAPTPPLPAPVADPHKPLPDEYVSEFGVKAHWLIENLGPSLIGALAALTSVWERAVSKELDTDNPTFGKWVAKALARVQWRDAAGNKIKRLPFELRIKLTGRTKGNQEQMEWPPTRQSEIFTLAAALQAAHAFVVLMSLGPRASELLSLWRGCVTVKKDGRPYADGRTYKLEQRIGGRARDWVLPDFALQCIEQQSRLISVAETLSPVIRGNRPSEVQPRKHLWGTVTSGVFDRTRPLTTAHLNDALRNFAALLGMPEKPDDQPLRVHRFRKTLARIVALALHEAPRILMSVFGHKSIAMTLYYILQDPDLREDIGTTERELRVMLVVATAEEMLQQEDARSEALRQGQSVGDLPSESALGGYGGGAAVRIHEAVVEQRDEAHRNGRTFDVKDIRELADVLTMNGSAWQLVRPGVICTKAPGQVGLCNMSKGMPEPSSCQAACNHTLEQSWHREDVDACLADAVEAYVKEGEEGGDLVQSFWADQIIGNLPRFPDLKEKWMHNATVQHIVAERERSDSETAEVST